MTQLLPNGKQQFIDINGAPLVGGKVFHYEVSTNTPKNTYQDIGLTILNTNPVICDARGQAGIYGSGPYRQVLKDSLDNLIWDQVIPDPAGTAQLDLGNSSDPTKGAALIGYKSRTVYQRLSDVISVMDSDGATPGALGNGGDDFAAIQHKIVEGQPLLASLKLPTGKQFRVGSAPSNPTGVPFVGDGRLAIPENGGVRQLNTAWDNGPVVGREYLYRAWSFIQTQDGDRTTIPAGGPSSNLNILLEGDSTAVGYVANIGPTPVTPLPAYLAPAVAIKNQLNNNGVRYVTVSNQAVSGTSWADFNALPDLSATLALIFVKYGINDATFTTGGVNNPQAPVADRIAYMASVMRAKLAAIRAAPNGSLSQVSIVLVGPTSTADSVNGRNEEWYEQVRKVYVQAARDYQCCYIDPYPFIRDSRTGGLLWMDQPYGGTEPGNTGPRTVHQRESAMDPLWAWIIDSLFPREALLEWGAASFKNIGTNGAGEIANAALGPLGYNAGVTWQWATTGGGFPKNGWLKTERFADGVAKQTITPVGALGGDNAMITRQTATSLTTWITRWTGVAEAVTPLNGWADFSNGLGVLAPIASAILDEQGFVQVRGSLKGGTVTATTTICALPAGMRPPAPQQFACVLNNTTLGTVQVNADGSVVLLVTGNATQTSLDMIRFKAA